MLAADLVDRGSAALTICNACRYCEEYCPVFPAIERRRTFAGADLMQLANLCHNCGECLYACQYAPPHTFGVNVPRTMAEVRRESYVAAAWPVWAGHLFARQGIAAGLTLWALLSLLAISLVATFGHRPLWPTPPGSDFYGVVPHKVIVAMFGAVGLLVTMLVALGATRFWRMSAPSTPVRVTAVAVRRAVAEALALTHLHNKGRDCVSGEESPSPGRRYFHHATSYGFLLCFASTTVAAAYHSVFGWMAPYAWTSLPVVLGTAGGVGLLVGPAGLFALGRRRDPALADPSQRGLDEGFITLLLATSATGLGLLAVRETPAMGLTLLVHMGAVLALFMTVPYGKSVHGLYRILALARDRAEVGSVTNAAGNQHTGRHPTRPEQETRAATRG